MDTYYANDDGTKINFEQKLQILMDIFSIYYRKDRKNTIQYTIPELGLELSREICQEAIEFIIEKITNNVIQSRKQTVPRWFEDFFTAVYALKGDYQIRCFTLNYDDFMDRCFENYADGFGDKIKDYSIFNNKRALISDENDILLNHLHGSVLFNYAPAENKEDQHILYKYDTAITSYGYFLPIITQDGRIAMYSPIITGMDKTNSIMVEPYQVYFANYARSLLSGDVTFIIGYGFGDSHINAVIDAAYRDTDQKIIIISPTVNYGGFGSFAESQQPNVYYNVNKKVIWYKMRFKEFCEYNLKEILNEAL